MRSDFTLVILVWSLTLCLYNPVFKDNAGTFFPIIVNAMVSLVNAKEKDDDENTKGKGHR